MSERTPRVSKPTPKGVELQAIRAAAAEKARKAAATRKLRATTKSEALKEPRSLKTKAVRCNAMFLISFAHGCGRTSYKETPNCNMVRRCMIII